VGDINHDDLCKMVWKGMVEGVKLDMDSKPEFCEVCMKAKAHRKPFPKKSTTRSNKVVTDLWCPADVTSLGKCDYALTFTTPIPTKKKLTSYS
ncbi:hypothetical protein B0H10DRAFT_1794008, partial [Mycena sp. CBHHK59/15]